MSTFKYDLADVVNTILARSGKEGVSADKAIELLKEYSIEVPGDSHQAQAMNLRALFAWVDPAVGGSKRGPGGGFVRAEHLAAASKKPQGVVSHLNKLREQGVTDDQLKEALAALARQQGVATT